MRSKAEVVVIGGGVSGVGIAYNLAKMGMSDIVVVEKNYLGSGATGRSGGGFRAQYTTKDNIILARESIKLLKKLVGELRFNFLMDQGGYLIILRDEEAISQAQANIKLQNSLGVSSRLLDPSKAKKIVPYLDISRFLAATFCPMDGTLYPPALIWGFARAARKRGVEIHTQTTVTNIETAGKNIKAVITDKGKIDTPVVVNAAGAYSREIAAMVNVKLPNSPQRHEIMVSEPLNSFIDPMVLCLKTGLYFSQSLRGEIVGGIGDPKEPESYDISSSTRFLERFARELVLLMPEMRHLKIMRAWAGLYDRTPDACPILGPIDQINGFIQCNGFSGHGVMISPMTTKIIAEIIMQKKPSLDIEAFSLRRFEDEEFKPQEDYVFG